MKSDHPDDHAEDCGCSICKTRRSWIARENHSLLPPQVEIEETSKKPEAAAGEGSNEEKFHEPILGNNPEDTEESDILEDVHEATKGNSTGQTKGCDSNEMAEELNIPKPKICMKRKMTNSPTSSEASKTLCRHPLVKKDSAKNKRHEKEPPGSSHTLPEPIQRCRLFFFPGKDTEGTHSLLFAGRGIFFSGTTF